MLLQISKKRTTVYVMRFFAYPTVIGTPNRCGIS